jgi:hypothetical protein
MGTGHHRLDSQKFADELDKLAPVLHAVAQLAGAPATAHRDIGGVDSILLPLVCDPRDLHRRKIWEAFGSGKGDRRCGRWSALVALGATIRAWPKLDEFTAYRQPAPLERRTRPAPWPHSVTEYWVDPEDPDYEPLEPEPKPRIRQLAR